jgi:LPS-assembly protein
VRAELVRFERADSVIGERLDLQPKLQFSWAAEGGYVTPTLKAWHTSYLLDSTPSGVSEGPRTLPLFSLDSGAFFERPLLLQDRPLLQTLEPRLYYLYVPFQNQSQLPVFDTELGDLNFAQIFQDNRFTGSDRVGDANQLTLGMTTRFLDRQTGVERLRASVGQIRYFEDRRVTLPGEPVETSSASDLLGEVSARLAARWSARLQLQWNPATQGTDKASVNVRYEPSEHRIVNVAYRFVNPELNQTDSSGVMSGLDQTDMAVLWPIGDRWTIVGRWNYSFEDRRTLQSVFGFGYESCCWAVRIAAREYVKTSGGGTNKAVFMELELKGLTRFGNRIEDLLERGILGYERG